MSFLVHLDRNDHFRPFVLGALGGVTAGVLLAQGYRIISSKVQSKLPGKGEKMKLYHTKIFRSARAVWMIAELGLNRQCDIINYNPYQESEESIVSYKKQAHPNGKVPALCMPNGDVIFEGAAICYYLARCSGQLLPPPEMYQHYYSLGVYAVASLDAFLHTLHIQQLKPEEKRDTSLMEQTEERLQEGLAFINAHLADKRFLCGDKFSAVDVIIGYTIMWASVYKGGVRLSTHPHLQKYLSRLKARRHFTPSVGSFRDWVMDTTPIQ